MKTSLVIAMCLAMIWAASPQAAPFAFITEDSGNVSVIDVATNNVVATIPVGNSPVGVAVAPAGNRVYVANSGDNTVSVIDTAQQKVIKTIAVGSNPEGIAVNPAGNRLYVTNNLDGNVSVLRVRRNRVRVIATIPVGVLPLGVVVNPAGTRVYVANNGASNTVSVIDAATNTVATTVNTGVGPEAFGMFIR